MDEFLQHNAAQSEQLKPQLYNKVRKCKTCEKVNAYSLRSCNNCGTVLTGDIINTPNVFSCFIYGVAKTTFPLSISIRKETSDILVIDDLLALAPCHLNAIPTDSFIPDVRSLLRNPAQGLALITKLEESCKEVFRTQFYPDLEFRKKVFRNGLDLEADAILSGVMAGFNFPPSQYQLHLQFIVAPLTPFHFFNYMRGLHYTFGRFIPLKYMKQVLALNKPLVVEDTAPIDKIFEYYRADVDYTQVHQQVYSDALKHQERLANWDPSDFDAFHIDNRLLFSVDGAPLDEKLSAVHDADKLVLQNYGRPYNSVNKPTGSYYSYSRDPANPLPRFGEDAKL